MIDSTTVLKNVEKFLDDMSNSERHKYLTDLGFVKEEASEGGASAVSVVRIGSRASAHVRGKRPRMCLGKRTSASKRAAAARICSTRHSKNRASKRKMSASDNFIK